MKNIPPKWEIVLMERGVADYLKVYGEDSQAVYLLHKGHTVSISGKHIWQVDKIGPPYAGYICIHCKVVIPEEIMKRWVKMRAFLIPS